MVIPFIKTEKAGYWPSRTPGPVKKMQAQLRSQTEDIGITKDRSTEDLTTKSEI